MNLLGLYVWKEWRDQRAGIFGLIAALPLLFVIASLAWEPYALDEALRRPGIAAALGALIALLVVGTDLIPGEVRRSRVRFLERLPAGLRRAFTAKLVFFASVTMLAAAYAALIATGLYALRHGTLPDHFLDTLSEQWVLPAIGCALWVFAVSAWVPYGALAFPAAAIVIALLCSPAWFFFGPHSLLVPTVGELRAFCVLSAAGAGVSAWFSFVRGYERGGGPARAARFGALAALVCLSPAWLWSAHRWQATRTVDPQSEHFQLHDAYLSEDGGCVYLNSTDEESGLAGNPNIHGLRVDSASGAWRVLDDGGGGIWPGEYGVSSDHGATLPRVRTVIVRSASGEIALDAVGHETAMPRDLAPRVGKPTALELGLDEHYRIWSWVGLGNRVTDVRERGVQLEQYYDPFRCRVFASAELFPDAKSHHVASLSIRPGRWLVQRTQFAPYELFDPETLASTPLVDVAPGDRIGPVLEDGRFLLASGGDVFAYSPETGSRERLNLRGGSIGRVEWILNTTPNNAPLAAFEPRIVHLGTRDGGGLARLDLEHREVVLAGGSRGDPQLVACEDANTLIAIEDRRRLVRLRFGTNERTLLFPR